MRRSEISEFSYGFALTNELIARMSLRLAPIFPNLVQEGRPGGGYDVLLRKSGRPLYIQFKLSQFMRSKNAKPAACIANGGFSIRKKFYRFEIMEALRSRQHEMLLHLDRRNNDVLYAAPRFHRRSVMNEAWRNGAIAASSILIRPRSIGPIHDNGLHYVAFDKRHAYFCSEAKKIEPVELGAVEASLTSRLEEDQVPLIDMLPRFLKDARAATADQLQRAIPVQQNVRQRDDGPRGALKELAEIANRDFNAMLFIAQLPPTRTR